jgi:hypothetical protein
VHPKAGIDTVAMTKNPVTAQPGTEPGHPARSLVSVLTELSWSLLRSYKGLIHRYHN